jgi:muramoyltetrapeptide carboxypeptidase
VIRPPRLRPGDRVAVVAPAGPVPRERFEAGARILGARYQLVYEERIFERTGFLAGSDEARLAELGRALYDPSFAAVVCARGGYGILRLLSRLDPAAFLRAPKPIVGFSDVTALHAWSTRSGVTTVHGPVVTQLGALPVEDAQSLYTLLESPEAPPPVEGLRALASGRAEGRLVGGNLELITRLLGTPFALDLAGAVLLIEEVGERPYRIDRQLTQLELAGALDGLRGVVAGQLHRCVEPDGTGPDAEAVLVERLGARRIPILAGAPVGHGERNRALPLGVPVRVDGDRGTLELLGSAVC